MDGIADIKACRKFANILHDNFTPNYDLELTKLSTKIERLLNDDDHVLIFYLHHSDDPFSHEFCFSLTNATIEEAFRKNNLVLYGWDISNEDLKGDLILSCERHLDLEMANYIIESKSVAFAIVSYNRSPLIFKVITTPQDLISLNDLLLETRNEKIISPLDFQRSMETLMNTYEYTSYEREDYEELKENIKYALYGPPNETEEEIKKKPYKEQKIIEDNMIKLKEAVEELFNKILETNNMYCKWNGRVVIKIIYICALTLPKEKAKKAKEFAKENKTYHPDSDFVPYPVFILRKCKRKCLQSKSCRIVIDIEGRVYESWNAFLENNRLPPCEIFYPKDGRYLSDDETEYCIKLSPACNPLKKAAAVTDVAAGVTGALAGGVTIASTSAAVVGIPFLIAAAPITLPIAAAIGIGSGLYAVGRGIHSLVDRKKHKQDIDLRNAESRGSYLNIAGGVMSAGMFGAMRTVSFLVGSGFQLGEGTRFLLHGLNGLNLTIGGMGITNAIHQAIKAKTQSSLVIPQLGASILFFAHSVYTYKNMDTIIKESQKLSLSEIKIILRSNRHIHTFNKLLKESISTHEQEKGPIITSIRKMRNVDEIMTVLRRSNYMLNQEGIRFSAVDEQIMLNDRPVDIMNFGSMSRSSETFFLKTFPPIPENLTANIQSIITADVKVWISGLGIMGAFILQRDVNQLIEEILSAFEKVTRDYILDITKQLFNTMDKQLLQSIANQISHSFIKLMKWICNELINNKLFQNVLNKGTSAVRLTLPEIDSIVETLENDFCSLYTNYEFDKQLEAIRKEQRRSQNPWKVEVKCTYCGGYYYQKRNEN